MADTPAGGTVTPGRDVEEWQNAKVLLGKDADGAYRVVGVDSEGRIATSAEIDAGDIEIGAVELKDRDSETRADIAADGANNGLFVQSNSLATQATLATRASQATLATRASEATVATLNLEATQADVRTAVQIVDNIVGTVGGADPGGVAMIGSLAETTVPGAAADGTPVQMNLDEYGRPRIAGYDPAVGALSVNDVAPAQMQVLIITDWVALAASAAETPAVNVQDYENHHFGFLPTGLGAGETMAMIIWHSFEGTNWYPLESFTLDGDVAADALPSSRYVSGFKTKYIKIELDVLTGTASVTPQLMSGN